MEVDNGYVINTYFRYSGSTGIRIKIKLDLTKKENETVLLPLVDMNVIHPFSDDFECKVKGYSLKELYSEKVRSLFQRVRPRDLYDIWILSKENLDVGDIIQEKFGSVGVGFVLSDVEEKKNHYLNAWNNSLKHQMKDVPEFETVFNDVLAILKKIENSI
jgi:predicted nucleotidyltransferase component of viral defense system